MTGSCFIFIASQKWKLALLINYFSFYPRKKLNFFWVTFWSFSVSNHCASQLQPWNYVLGTSLRLQSLEFTSSNSRNYFLFPMWTYSHLKLFENVNNWHAIYTDSNESNSWKLSMCHSVWLYFFWYVNYLTNSVYMKNINQL